MYRETRGYVMRRADSVKQLGTAVLDSRVTAVTAGALDRALTTADKYVDKYLPPDHQDVADGECGRRVVEGFGGGYVMFINYMVRRIRGRPMPYPDDFVIGVHFVLEL